MAVFNLTKPINGARLVQELRAAGLIISNGGLYVADDKIVIREVTTATDISTAQSVINSHDAAPTEPEQRPGKVRDKVVTAIATLESNVSVKATWDGKTAAQRQEITRQALLMLAKLARLVVSQYDAVE